MSGAVTQGGDDDVIALPPREVGRLNDVARVQATLRELADDPTLERRDQSLHELADALTNDDGYLWAKVDLYEAFGEDAIVVEREQSRAQWLGRVEFARNVCILLPLLITWMGITYGIRAYQQLLEAPLASEADLIEAPFVQLWTGGFGGRTWWTFDRVGLLDVTAIFLVVALSIWAGVLRKQLEVDTEKRRAEIANRLRSALTDASVILARRAYDAPARFSEELSRMWSKYDSLAVQITQASKDFSESVRSSTDYTKHLDAAVIALNEGSRAVGEQATSFGISVEQLRTDIAGLADQTRSLVGEITSVSAQQGAAVAAIAAALDSARATAETLQQASNELPARVKQIGDELVTGVRAEATTRTEAARELADAAARVSHLADELRHTADGFSGSADQLRQAAGTLPNELLQASDRLAALVEQTNNATASLPSRLTEGLTPLAHVHDRLHEIEAMQQATHSTAAQTLDRLGSLQGSLEAGLTQLTASVDALAASGVPAPPALESAAENLERAARACEHLASELTGVAARPRGNGGANGDGGEDPDKPWRWPVSMFYRD